MSCVYEKSKKLFVKTVFLFLFLMMTAFSSVFAEDFSLWGSGTVFKLSPVKDSVLLGSSLALNGVNIILDKGDFVKKDDFDGKLYDKNDVNAFDRLIMNPYSKGLDYLGSGFETLALVSPAVLLTTQKDEWLTLGIMYAETLAVAQGAAKVIKLSVTRARPYMYFDGYPQKKVDSGDWCNSFPSGHSTMAFAAAAFTSYTFCSYFPDSKLRLPVIAASYSAAAATACMRLASGNHFLTDVITGALIGSASGFLVPFLHRVNESAATEHFLPELLPSGVSFTVRM